MTTNTQNQTQDQDTSHHRDLVARFYPASYLKKVGLKPALKAFSKAFLDGGEEGLKKHLLEVKAKAEAMEG